METTGIASESLYIKTRNTRPPHHLKRGFSCIALIPPFFLDCVVAIGLLFTDGAKVEKRWVASGFVYGQFAEQHTDGRKEYYLYLVTSRHVFAETSKKGFDKIYLRFNPNGTEAAKEFDVPLRRTDGQSTWFAHADPEVDLAVVPLDGKFLESQGIKFAFFQSDVHVLNRTKATEMGVTEGDGVYVLGFPMGLVGGQRNFVIVRQGSIARIRDALSGGSKEFLIDSFVFPGNSGGPVVLKPDINAIEGTKSQQRAYLLGVVKSYLPYLDRATSEQTQRPRILFEENSGLASIIPADFVGEVIEQHLKTRQK